MQHEKQSMIIGKPLVRVDARAKVCGREKYAADYYGQDLLWAGAKRAGVAHARIKGIDVARAAALKGVEAVLTHRDVGGTNRYGVVENDQPVLADDKVRHCGDPVALVVARNPDVLSRAIELVEVEYEILPAVFDVEKALAPDAVLVHEGRAGGNVLLKGQVVKGDVDRHWQRCAHVVEAEYSFCHQEHACLETECGWALAHADGRLEIVASTQSPFRDRHELALALGLEAENIRLKAPYCGGAFGGKDGITVQALLALAALKCPGRPVKLWLSRNESILASCKRHPARLLYRLGAGADGGFQALEVKAYYDTGPYDHLGVAVMTLGLEHAGGPYRIGATRLQAWAVYTNNPVGGPFRGFGVPQVAAAMEQTVDLLAEKMGLCPLELRLKNALRQGDVNPVGLRLETSTGIAQCLEAVREHRLWKERHTWKSAAGPFKKRGLGLAAVMQAMGYGPEVPDVGQAKLELTDQGRFRIYAGVVDMGQGNASTYLQMASAILGQDMEQMELVLPDTDRTLPSGSSSASRTTYTFGNALLAAARAMAGRIKQQAAAVMGLDSGDSLELVPGRVQVCGGKPSLPLAGLLPAGQRMVTTSFQAPVATQAVDCDPILRAYGITHYIFSYAVHLALVEVDTLTGQVQCKGFVAVTDCGKIVNPQLFQQQMHGGIAQGLGYGLWEQFVVDQGRILTCDLATYIVPGAGDVPEMQCLAVNQAEPSGPFGLKGAGEIAMNGPAPAVANAVADACGVRVPSLPLTADKVLEALHGQTGLEELSET